MQTLPTFEALLQAMSEASLGEHKFSNLELKSSWTQEYGKKLSSLANRALDVPCWLVVGVNDKGALVGHKEQWAKTEEEKIAQHVNQYLDPSQSCAGIHPIETGGNWVIVIAVRNPGAVVRWNGKAYKGAGTAKDEMSPSETMGLQVSLPGLEDYTAQSEGNPILNKDLVASFAARLARRADEPEFSKIAEASAQEVLKTSRIEGTRASSLLFGPTRWRIVEFDENGEVLSNKTREGLYHVLLDETNRTLRRWGNSDHDLFPQKAIREALGNAVAHAAYFQKGGDVIIEVHPDRLTISNLCLPASAHFANKWFSRSHHTVNPLLMETLRLAGHVDEVGRGKSVMMKELLQNGHPPPKVISESAGQYQRWKCIFYRRGREVRDTRLFERLKGNYHDERKALLATALVHWHDEPLSAIRQYVDDESLELFADVMSDPVGPVIADPEHDRVLLRRWAEVLMGHGQDSKALDSTEEEAVKVQVYMRSRNSRDKIFTLRDVREIAGMGSTDAEQVLSSNLVKKWCQSGEVTRKSHGKYSFTTPPKSNRQQELVDVIIKILRRN